MNRRGAGIGLLGIGAVLYTGRYIGAAIMVWCSNRLYFSNQEWLISM